MDEKPLAAEHTETLRRALMVAFHFPPLAESSGLLRTLCFARDLLPHGWRSSVLSVSPRVYPATRDDLLKRIPATVSVDRAFALDISRDIAIGGRYPEFLCLPDRWSSWLLGGLGTALRQWRRWQPQLIWSTYPIATAHLLGGALARLTATPWVADFRDPMVEQDRKTGAWVPGNRRLRSSRLWVERMCAVHAARLVFCTEGARRIFVERYGPEVAGRCRVIPNGYDEEIFADVEREGSAARPRSSKLTLVHSGVIYATRDRDPTAFFEALGRLIARQVISPVDTDVVLRASGSEQVFKALTARYACSGIVRFLPSIPYEDALREMLDADIMLIFQGYPSNPAIPAKLYEYIRARRPVFAMAHADGDTAKLVGTLNLGPIADLEDALDIETKLESLIRQVRDRQVSLPSMGIVASYARAARGRELARVFDELVAGAHPARPSSH